MANQSATPNIGWQNKFSTTLSSGITASDTTIPLNSLPTPSEGFLVIEPDSSTTWEVIYYTSKTGSAVVCTSAANGRGVDDSTAQSHSAGATVRMDTTAGMFEVLQNGTALNAGALGSTPFATGWISSVLPAVSSVAANGNRSYNVTFASTVAALTTPGQRMRFTRTVAAPTQCTSLNGSTQYYSKSSPAGMTFTDDFVVSAWIKLTSYTAGAIVSRYNGTSGWQFIVNNSGQLTLSGFNGGSGNSSSVTSYQSVPLNKWVHVAGQLDMSSFTATTTTSYFMIDGVDVPSTVTRAGTNPTALIQAGNLEVGTSNAGTFFPGKLAQVAIYNAKVTQANVLATISQGLSGSETSLISAYSFNNSINDLNANANNLTAQGSAVATNADSPFGVDATGTPGTYDYGIVTKVATTVATVQVPEGNAIPTTGGVSAVDLSAWKAPFGMPVQKNRWRVLTTAIPDTGLVTVAGTTPTNVNGMQISIPIGEWEFGAQCTIAQDNTVAGNSISRVWLNSSVTPSTANALATFRNGSGGASVTEVHHEFNRSVQVSLSSATIHTLVFYHETGSGTGSYRLFGSVISDTPIMYADLTHL